MLKIGLVNFLNAYPLYFGLEEHSQRNKTFQLFYEAPSVLSEQMQEKKLDVSLLSSIEYSRRKNIWNFFSGLGVASKGKVESIRFFMNPQHPFLKEKEIIPLDKVYLDYASKTSVEMCKMLLRQYQEISPKFEIIYPPHQERLQNLKLNEAALLIGDQALMYRHYPSLDVGEWYFKIFNKIFVYALWVYRKDLEKENTSFSTPKQQKILYKILKQAYSFGQANFDVMVEKASKKFSFEKDYCRYYFKEIIHYQIDNELETAMQFFFSNAPSFEK